MSKLNETPITEKEILNYLDNNDDFQLEMAILNLCNKNNLITQHGGSYEDPITKKTRQFDIRAKIKINDYFIRMSIECKNLQKYYPLLVSRLPRTKSESFHEIIFSSSPQIGSMPLPPSAFFHSKRISDNSIYKINEFTGKSTIQIGKSKSNNELSSGDSEIYDKWSQAINSAYDLIIGSQNDYRYSEIEECFSFIIPILVISNETLWIADYDENGDRVGVPYQSDSCDLFIDKTYNTGNFDYTLSHLKILTKKGFEHYLDLLLNDESHLQTIFPKELNQ